MEGNILFFIVVYFAFFLVFYRFFKCFSFVVDVVFCVCVMLVFCDCASCGVSVKNCGEYFLERFSLEVVFAFFWNVMLRLGCVAL